jgi:hypothetical protein
MSAMENGRLLFRQFNDSTRRELGLTLPRFCVHQIDGNFLMNGERDEREKVGAESAVHG